MKLLIVDTDGLALSFAWRAAVAGHDVRWFLPEKFRDTGAGFKGITKIDNWVQHMEWADLVITSSNSKYMERLDFFRKKGLPVFGPTPASANLEISRQDGMKFMEKCGIETVSYKTFASMKDAQKHIQKTNERFVFKTLGDNENKALTYVSKGPHDLLEWIDRAIANKMEPKGEVMLQTFIKGIEMGVSRFMGSKGWVGPWNESFEHKKLMSGNYGPNTGEMGTIAYFTKESKLGVETLAKCEKELVKLGHTGDVAIGFMIDEQGKPWPTEWTCRFGWPIANMMLGATTGDPIAWMKDALDGKDTTTFKEDIGCCLVLAHGNFPAGQEDSTTKDVPIYGITKGNKKHLHPQAVSMRPTWDVDNEKLIKRPNWVTAGAYVLVVTGFGDSVKQATTRAYKTAKQLNLSDQILRDDIGEGLAEQLPELHKMGYAKHCEYGHG